MLGGGKGFPRSLAAEATFAIEPFPTPEECAMHWVVPLSPPVTAFEHGANFPERAPFSFPQSIIFRRKQWHSLASRHARATVACTLSPNLSMFPNRAARAVGEKAKDAIGAAAALPNEPMLSAATARPCRASGRDPRAGRRSANRVRLTVPVTPQFQRSATGCPAGFLCRQIAGFPVETPETVRPPECGKSHRAASRRRACRS